MEAQPFSASIKRQKVCFGIPEDPSSTSQGTYPREVLPNPIDHQLKKRIVPAERGSQPQGAGKDNKVRI